MPIIKALHFHINMRHTRFHSAFPLTRSFIGEFSALQYTVTALLKCPGLSALYVMRSTASLPGCTGSPFLYYIRYLRPSAIHAR